MTTRVLLDKLSIDQSNNEAKQAGILRLPAYLRHSDRMVVLWSERYFTRLWCTAEVASRLMMNQGGREKLVFMPVPTGFARLFLSIAASVGQIAFSVLRGFLPFYIFASTFALVFAAILVPVSARLRRDALAVKELPTALASFSITEAQCFCCTNGHVHPETKEPMLCDRNVIYDFIKDLSTKEAVPARASSQPGSAHPSPVPSGAAVTDPAGECPRSSDIEQSMRHLNAFDQLVRTQLRDQVQAQLGKACVPFRLILCTYCVPTILYCATLYRDYAAVAIALDFERLAGLLVRDASYAFAAQPALIRVCWVVAGKEPFGSRLWYVNVIGLWVCSILIFTAGRPEYLPPRRGATHQCQSRNPFVGSILTSAQFSGST